MVEDIIGISIILGARGLDLEPLRGLEKALGLTHGLGAHWGARYMHGDACTSPPI